ncbi:DUF3085 domain-containing protein [Oleiharenicola sp. Vm1]|uniref:DUF3085 domain-containing protein n=1 Tax=Oleiharenicola sp. Vm1 TaxID=3398393 RepID=UPI0039F4EA81
MNIEHLTLVFRVNDDLRAIVKHAQACTQHLPTYDQLFDGRYRKDGRTIAIEDCLAKKEPFPKSEDVDVEKIPPALHFVKDRGCYLMSSGSPRDIVKDTTSRVVYADGFSPDGEWIGGDDFVQALDLAFFAKNIEAGATAFHIRVTEEAISMSAMFPRRQPMPPAPMPAAPMPAAPKKPARGK